MAVGLDDVTLLLGDAIEQMRMLPDACVDLVASDPPYGTTACSWDAVIPFGPYWEQIKRVLKPGGAVVLTASQPFTSALVMSNPRWFRYEWVWNKSRGSGHLNSGHRPLITHENVLVFFGETGTYNPQFEQGTPYKISRQATKTGSQYGKHAAIEGEYEGIRVPRSSLYFGSGANGQKCHPTQKPVALFEYLIRTYSNEGAHVLDCSMGSGTTIVAAINTGRKATGIEKDPEIFEKAKHRIASAALPLFDISPSAVTPNPSLAPSPTRPPLANQSNFFDAIDAIDGGMPSKGA